MADDFDLTTLSDGQLLDRVLLFAIMGADRAHRDEATQMLIATSWPPMIAELDRRGLTGDGYESLWARKH